MSTSKKLKAFLEQFNPSMPVFIQGHSSLSPAGRPIILDGMWVAYDPADCAPVFISQGPPEIEKDEEFETQRVGYLSLTAGYSSTVKDWINTITGSTNATKVLDFPLYYSDGTVLFFGEATSVNVEDFKVLRLVFDRSTCNFVECDDYKDANTFVALVMEI